MKIILIELSRFCAMIVIGIFALIISFDAISFHDLVDRNDQSEHRFICCSWYDQSWVTAPYTNFRLAMKPATYHWTKNAVGESWYVKDVKFGNTVFWTIVDRCGGPEPVKACPQVTNESNVLR